MYNKLIDMTSEITKLKAEVERLKAENCEIKEKLIDYQKFVRIVNAKMAMDALEDWFNDDDDDDE